jgi:hypothetical protein
MNLIRACLEIFPFLSASLPFVRKQFLVVLRLKTALRRPRFFAPACFDLQRTLTSNVRNNTPELDYRRPCICQYSFSTGSVGFGFRDRQSRTSFRASKISTTNAIAINVIVIWY